MMSDISLNPAQRQPAVTDVNAAPRAPQVNSAPTNEATTAAPTDSVNLSPAAQLTAGSVANGSALNEKDAEKASVGLRQSIGGTGLSVSARQNQAILSLLR
jgi:hypothetical protein